MNIQVEIHLSYDSDVWAYGFVTLENFLRFPVQLRKYKDPETNKEISFISYPRRQRNGKCSYARTSIKGEDWKSSWRKNQRRNE